MTASRKSHEPCLFYPLYARISCSGVGRYIGIAVGVLVLLILLCIVLILICVGCNRLCEKMSRYRDKDDQIPATSAGTVYDYPTFISEAVRDLEA